MIKKEDVMKSISKALLLSVVGLCVDSGSMSYATMKISDSVPKSGIPTLHIHHTYLRHTQEIPFSSRLFDDSKISGEEQKVASVCSITDAGNCSGQGYGNLETPDGGGPDEHGTPEKLCKEAGYTNVPCPEGSASSDLCPYDSSYHGKCSCAPEFDKTCTGYDEQGVGESCGDKYKECCNLCYGYDHTSIPTGYISAGECDSCDGKKYKVKCDPTKYPTTVNCGSQGGSSNSCTDDDGTHYEKCNCPLNYEWNASTASCVCGSQYQYTCDGPHAIPPKFPYNESCGGKYKSCSCDRSDYAWVSGSNICSLKGIREYYIPTAECVVGKNIIAIQGTSTQIRCSLCPSRTMSYESLMTMKTFTGNNQEAMSACLAAVNGYQSIWYSDGHYCTASGDCY